MAWWQQRPLWLRWSVWAAVMAAVVTVSNFARALDAINPLLPATRGYVGDALNPVLVATLRNAIDIIDGKEAVIRVRLQMAVNRLHDSPGDPFFMDAFAAAQKDLEDAEFNKSQAQCSLRLALGLGCSALR